MNGPILIKSRIVWPPHGPIGHGSTGANKLRFHFEDTFTETVKGEEKIFTKPRTAFVEIAVGAEIEVEGVTFWCRTDEEAAASAAWERELLSKGKQPVKGPLMTETVSAPVEAAPTEKQFQVLVTKVDAVRNHGESLTIVTVGDHEVVANKTEDGQPRWTQGEICVYVPEGAIIPDDVLQERGYWDAEKNRGMLEGNKMLGCLLMLMNSKLVQHVG